MRRISVALGCKQTWDAARGLHTKLKKEGLLLWNCRDAAQSNVYNAVHLIVMEGHEFILQPPPALEHWHMSAAVTKVNTTGTVPGPTNTRPD